MKDALRRLEKEREALAAISSEDKKKIEGLERSGARTAAELQDTSARLREATSRLESSQTAVDQLRAEVQQLHLELSGAKARLHEKEMALASEQDRVRETRGALDETRSALRVAESELERLRPKEQELHDVRMELREAQAAILSLSSDRQRLQELVARAEDKIQDLSGAYERAVIEAEEREQRLRREHQAVVEQLRSELASANDLIDQLQQKAGRLERELSEAQARGRALESDLTLRGHRVAELERQLAEALEQLSAARRHGEALEAMRDSLESQVERQLREIDTLTTAREDLMSDLAIANKKLGALTSEKADLTQQLAASQREAQKLAARLKETAAELEEETRNRVDLEAELESRVSELRSAQSDLARARDRIQELDSSLDDAASRERRLQTECAELGDRLARASGEVKSLGDLLQERNEFIARLKEELQGLEARIGKHLEDIDELKEERSVLNTQLADARAKGEMDRKSLEERVRAHRRLMAEVCLMLGVQGVGVSSDYTSTEMHTHVINSVREVLARASGMSARAYEAEADAAKLSELLDRYGRMEEAYERVVRELESARRQQAQQEADTDSEVKMLRSKAARLEREVEDMRSRGPSAGEVTALQGRLHEAALRNVELESKLRMAQEEADNVRDQAVAVIRSSPGREELSELRARSRRVADLEGEVRGLQAELARLRESSQRAQADAQSRRSEAESLRQALEVERFRTRDLEGENQRLILAKDDVQRTRVDLQTQLDSLRLESISREARTRTREGARSPGRSYAGSVAFSTTKSPGASGSIVAPSPLRQPQFPAATPSSGPRNYLDPKGGL